VITDIIGCLFISFGALSVIASITKWCWFIKYVIRQEYPPDNLKRTLIGIVGLFDIGFGMLFVTGIIWNYAGSGIPGG
jgi:hypothetical protein